MKTRGGVKLLTFVMCAALAGCGGRSDDMPDLGLERMELILTQENQIQLFHGGMAKLKVPARLVVAGRTYAGELSLSGNFTIDAAKKSYRFDSSETIVTLGFESVKFSAQTQDPSYLRMTVAAEMFREMGVPAPFLQPVALFVNTRYVGIYLAVERIDGDFYKRRGFDPERIYQANTNTADFDEEMIGDPDHGFESKGSMVYSPELKRLAREAMLPADSAQFARLGAALDLDNAIGFLAVRSFIGDCDGIENNIYLHLDRSDSKLRFSGWDWERAWFQQCELESFRSRNRLFAKLLEHDPLRTSYLEKLRTLLRKYPTAKLTGLTEREGLRIKAALAQDPHFVGHDGWGTAATAELVQMMTSWSKQIESYVGGTSLALVVSSERRDPGRKPDHSH